jgi:ComF family protein
MPRLLTRATSVALDLLFPPQCALCRRGGTLLCEECAEALPAARSPRCARCWMPNPHGGPCNVCLAHPPAYRSVRSGYVMEAGARRLAHELKYEGMTALAGPMAQLLSERVRVPAADVIVPVPLHRSRQRSRGYNQAAVLGKHLAVVTGIPHEARAARRVRNTMPLVKTMHRAERRAIVDRAFDAEPERIEGRTVLLVDDVCTTGATLDACSVALLEAGATAVYCLTWARAD